MNFTRFGELPSSCTRNLLLGNGFSCAVDQRFAYTSLLDESKTHGFLGSDVEDLFREFGTEDFEYVLSQLWTCVRVATQLRLDQTPYLTRYGLVRESLARAIRSVHPRHQDLDQSALVRCAKNLRERYCGIFTLNYDLLLYWILAAGDFDNVVDFFWNSDLRFDPASCSERKEQVPIFYLHGALFLSSDENGTTKLKGELGKNLLDQIEERWKDGHVPVFVSEGTWEQKARAIRREPYLSFALSRFARMQGGLTIFGASLGESDRHIIDAMSANRELEAIAVSIRAESDEDREEGIENFENRLQGARKRGARLYYFDAREFSEAVSLPVLNGPPPAAGAVEAPEAE